MYKQVKQLHLLLFTYDLVRLHIICLSYTIISKITQTYQNLIMIRFLMTPNIHTNGKELLNKLIIICM